MKLSEIIKDLSNKCSPDFINEMREILKKHGNIEYPDIKKDKKEDKTWINTIHKLKKIKQEVAITLDFNDLFWIVVDFWRKNPEVMDVIGQNINKKEYYRQIKCPFPGRCNEFPCETLNCNADCCDNGRAYRMS